MNKNLKLFQDDSDRIYNLIDNIDPFVDLILEVEEIKENNELKFYIKDINTKYSEHLQMTYDEIVGKDIFDVYDDTIASMYYEIVVDLYKTKINQSAKFYFEKGKEGFKIIDKDVEIQEDTVYLESTIYPLIKRNKLKEIFIVIKNITKQLKEMKESREKDAVKIYNDKMMSMSDIITNLSHVWRQPLNSLNFCIINLIDEIKSEYEDRLNLDDYYQEMWEIIKNLSKKIEKFQAFFEPESESKFFEVEKYIYLTFEIMEEKIKKDNIKLNIDIDKNIKMYGFPNEFAQLMYHIFYDLIEYCKNNFDINNRILNIKISSSDDKINIIIKIKYDREKYKNINFKFNNLLMIKNIVEKKMKGNINIINNNIEKEIDLSFLAI